MGKNDEYLVQARFLLDGLVTASCERERQSVATLALIVFDHDDTALHDELCAAGVITVLTLCLQKSVAWKAELIYAALICRLLGMALRCSRSRAVRCFHQVGTNLMTSVFTLLLESSCRENMIKSDDPVASLIDQLASLRIALPSVKKKEKLVTFLQQILRNADSLVTMEVRTEAMKMLAGLTQHQESKMFAMMVPSLVNDVVSVIAEPNAETLYLHGANFLRHLAWDTRNKSELARNRGVIQTLLLLDSRGNMETRAAVIATLQHLSYDAKNKLRLLKFGRGAVVQALVNATKYPNLHGMALETLLLLVCQSTAAHMIKQFGLIQVISSAAVAKNALHNNSTVLAAQSLKRLSAYITIGDNYFQLLSDSLLELADSTDVRIRICAAKAFLQQSLLSTNGFYMARAAAVLHVVIKLATDTSPAVRMLAVETLFNLSSDKANTKRMVSHPDVLETFVVSAGMTGTSMEFTRAGRCAIEGILVLANHRSAKSRVAKHLGLVAALSRYGVSSDSDTELKRAALHGVIVLAPLL